MASWRSVPRVALSRIVKTPNYRACLELIMLGMRGIGWLRSASKQTVLRQTALFGRSLSTMEAGESEGPVFLRTEPGSRVLELSDAKAGKFSVWHALCKPADRGNHSQRKHRWINCVQSDLATEIIVAAFHS